MTGEPPEREPPPDSFYAHLAGAAKSRTGRSALAMAWPYVLAATTAVSGYVAKSLEIESRVVAMDERLGAIARDVGALRLSVAEMSVTEQRKVIRIGRQAAYATAGFEAYEPAQLKQKKQAWAEKYAAAFQRMVAQEGASPDVAYTALFRQVDTP